LIAEFTSTETDSVTRSLRSVLKFLRRDQNDENLHAIAWQALEQAYAESPLSVELYQPAVYEILKILLRTESVKHQYLSTLMAKQILGRYRLQLWESRPDQEAILVKLEQDELLQILLKSTFNTDLTLEAWLCALRRRCLVEYSSAQLLSDQSLKTAAMLAQQAFNSEYVWPISVSESASVNEIRSVVEEPPESIAGLQQISAILVLGTYQPIDSLPAAFRVAEEQSPAIEPEVGAALTRLVLEPELERKLACQIAQFGDMANPRSQAVRSHYEKNPFPRWINLGTPRYGLTRRLHQFSVEEGKSHIELKKGGKLLVAGCGTGQQPISLAKQHPDAEIVAFDLSMKSLAYAQRMADKYQIQNLRFLHGDVLDAEVLCEKFDHIECVGVLHCLEAPLFGFDVLKKILKPGGTMHIGVYSKAARMPIEWIRGRSPKRQEVWSTEEIRSFRQTLILEPQFKQILPLLLVQDFFSTSMFRDLLLHQQEYCFALNELLSIVRELHYEFLGFDLGKDLTEKYKRLFPSDTCFRSPENWQAFEIHYAGTLQMFMFWLRKPV